MGGISLGYLLKAISRDCSKTLWFQGLPKQVDTAWWDGSFINHKKIITGVLISKRGNERNAVQEYPFSKLHS